MRIDEARHDDHVAVIIDLRCAECLRQKRLRAGPQDGAVVAHDDRARLSCGCRAVGGEAQRLALDDVRHGDTRSSMRKRKMRQTCESAIANSASASLLDARLEAVENHVLGGAFHREDEGKAEARLVGVVEVGEAGELLRRQRVEPCARLLPRRIIRELRLGGEIGMGADQRQLRIAVGALHGTFEGSRSCASRLAKGRKPRLARHPGRMLRHVAEGLEKAVGRHGVDVGDRHHCLAIHVPSLARSSSVMLVLLPSGMALFLHRLRLDLRGIALQVLERLELRCPWAPP